MAFAQGKYVVCPSSIAAAVSIYSRKETPGVTYLLVPEYSIDT